MNQLAEGSTRTLADRVFTRLQDDIVRGEIPPGSKVSETELAGRYGVSRGPLREAIRRLESRKLLEREVHVGTLKYKTSVKPRKLDPVWNEEATFQVESPMESVHV